MLDEIKVGSKVICIPYTQNMLGSYKYRDIYHPGKGYEEGLEFIVTTITSYSDGEKIYFGGVDGHGVRIGFIELSKRKFKLKRK